MYTCHYNHGIVLGLQPYHICFPGSIVIRILIIWVTVHFAQFLFSNKIDKSAIYLIKFRSKLICCYIFMYGISIIIATNQRMKKLFGKAIQYGFSTAVMSVYLHKNIFMSDQFAKDQSEDRTDAETITGPLSRINNIPQTQPETPNQSQQSNETHQNDRTITDSQTDEQQNKQLSGKELSFNSGIPESQVNKQQVDQDPPFTLMPNQVEISESCPAEISQYLQRCGFQVLSSGQKKDELVLKIKNRNDKLLVVNSKEFQQQYNKNPCHFMFRISNFINPPHNITSKNHQELQQLLRELSHDEYLIATYIPPLQVYNLEQTKKTPLDTFTETKTVDLNALQNQFIQQKQNEGSNKNCYVIIRDKQIADSIKISKNKIGKKYVLYKSGQTTGNEASTILQGYKYTVKMAQKTNVSGLTFHYINQINIDGDMKNFLRKVESSGDKRKILVVSPRQKREEFSQRLNKVLLKVGRVMNKEVLIVLTENQKLIRKYFQIVPDQFVTIRLIDPIRSQKPLLKIPGLHQNSRTFYSRAIMSGPFSIQNICKFIQNESNMEYYQKKYRLGTIPATLSSQPQLKASSKNCRVIMHEKYGCKGCKMLNQYIEEIKKILNNIDNASIANYHIQNTRLLKNIQFRRFNILNQETGIIKNPPNHDLTPQLILHHPGGQKIDLKIGQIIGRINSINPQNQSQVHQQIIRDILERISREKLQFIERQSQAYSQ